MTEKAVKRDAKKAHQYAEAAYKANPQSYKAVFELATDYLAGEVRTGDANVQNIAKAAKLLEEGVKFARLGGNQEYVKLFQTRIDQARSLAGAE